MKELFKIDFQRIQRIEDLMHSFRLAAQDSRIKNKHAGYAYFPKGSCTWASFAFGKLLQELELDRHWYLVNGSNDDPLKNHDWLEDGQLAVDISADQFMSMRPYVGPAPPPAAQTRPNRQHIDLTTAAPAHLAALEDIRLIMNDH